MTQRDHLRQATASARFDGGVGARLAFGALLLLGLVLLISLGGAG